MRFGQPDWDDEECRYEVVSMLGNHAEVWLSWDDNPGQKSFACWLNALDGHALVKNGKLWDPKNYIARYLSARDLGLVA